MPEGGGWKLRNWIQMGIFVLTIAVGGQFYLYVLQVSGEGPVTVQRPPGVEGFLPIGALLGWKRFVATGHWDKVHPAAMVVFGYAGLICLAFRKSFCGWFCPVGTLSEWLWKAGRFFTGHNYSFPPWLDIPLRALKYLLLGFFLWAILSMSTASISAFLQGPYYKVSDVKMLFFFTRMSALSAWVIGFLAVASVFIQNFWCRYLCPYGALMGLLALSGPTHVRRRSRTCADCGRCAVSCPHQLPVDRKQRIISPECSGCMDCIAACPVPGTLSLTTGWGVKKEWSPVRVGVIVVLLFAGAVYTARITGYWQSRVPETEIRMLVHDIDSPTMVHPSVQFRR